MGPVRLSPQAPGRMVKGGTSGNSLATLGRKEKR